MSNTLLLLTVVSSLLLSFYISLPLISLPASSPQPPQFVDIPLEEEEDSSDEEYCPDEDEEDETTEEVRKSIFNQSKVCAM